jgi:hypothetical protein
MKIFIEDILGLKSVTEADNEKLRGVMQLLVDIRKEARSKKILQPATEFAINFSNWEFY